MRWRRVARRNCWRLEVGPLKPGAFWSVDVWPRRLAARGRDAVRRFLMKTFLLTAAILLTSASAAWTQAAQQCRAGYWATGACLHKPTSKSEQETIRALDKDTTAAIGHTAGARGATARVLPGSGGGFNDHPISSGSSINTPQSGSIGG